MIKGFLNNAAKPAAGTNGARYDGHHRDAGDRHRDRKEWLEAVACYERHLEHAPHDHAIWIQLGNVAKEAGQLGHSLGAYLKAMQLSDASPDLHMQLGHLNKLRKNRAAALGHYEKALMLDPDNVEAREELRRVRETFVHLPFILETTSLDDAKFTDVHELIAFSSSPEFVEDPFAKFDSLLSEPNACQ